MKSIRILHLEDSLKDSELIQSLIKSDGLEYDYFLADNEQDYHHILETENIDIILSDYNLPDYNGSEALKFAREKYSHKPFIFVSGAMGEDKAINAMLNGATDYVLKNKIERLVPAIKRAINEYELEIKRKQSEINLKEKNEEIESQNQRYIVINKELAEAKEKAEEMNRLKTNFLSNMSHELRTPMIGILGYSEMLRNEIEDSELKRMADSIHVSGKRLLNTLNLVLDLARIE
jgi:signal transduction histidine kinase